jgi:hypothetical protein
MDTDNIAQGISGIPVFSRLKTNKTKMLDVPLGHHARYQ